MSQQMTDAEALLQGLANLIDNAKVTSGVLDVGRIAYDASIYARGTTHKVGTVELDYSNNVSIEIKTTKDVAVQLANWINTILYQKGVK